MISSILSAMLCITAIGHAQGEGERCQQSEEAVQAAVYGHIDAKGLKAVLDARMPLVLLDGRGNNWHDGTIIPGAKLAWYEDSAEDFAKLIPNLDTLVVVYCYSFSCPLSPRLAQKLVDLGYRNVVEYAGGLSQWRDVAHYDVETIE